MRPKFRKLKIMDQGQIELSGNAINFASVVPTPELFPVEEFKSILNEVLDRDRGNAFGYQESQGFYPLRESVAQYFLHYGITTDADHIQVISGAQQGIDIIAKSLLNYADFVITENSYVYRGNGCIQVTRCQNYSRKYRDRRNIHIPTAAGHPKISSQIDLRYA